MRTHGYIALFQLTRSILYGKYKVGGGIAMYLTKLFKLIDRQRYKLVNLE